VKLNDLVSELDAYFRVPDVRGDDWAGIFEFVYPDPYWREFVEPGYEGRWNGLLLRGSADPARVRTCVFPSDAIIAAVEPRSLLFSEHPIAFEDDVRGFEPLDRESFERMKAEGISFYHVHAPLDQHPDVSPSRLCAEGVGLTHLDEYFPIAEGVPGGAAIAGDSDLTLDELAASLHGYLGEEVPVDVLTRPREEAGRVAMVAGRGRRSEHSRGRARARLSDVRDRKCINPLPPRVRSGRGGGLPETGRRVWCGSGQRDALRDGETAPARDGRLVSGARAGRRVQAWGAGVSR
jgi:putative NIF3 family GTP cyclohydrolase 1 type 2